MMTAMPILCPYSFLDLEWQMVVMVQSVLMILQGGKP